MLILTRRPAETIYIGEQVTVTVLGVVGNQVRFGIEAPRSITIDRAEIHERKKRAALNNANGTAAPVNGATNGHVVTASIPNGNVAEEHREVEVEEVNGNVDDGTNGHVALDVAPTLKLRR
jgi:carbon storage regulator